MSKRSENMRAAACGVVALAFGCGFYPGASHAGEPAAPAASWEISDWTPSLGETLAAGPNGSLDTGGLEREAKRSGPPAVRWGQSEVRFAPVAGAPGAMVKPDGSPVSVGFGLQPLQASEPQPFDPSNEPRNGGLANIDNGFSGALAISETRAGVTQSMSITSPLSAGLDSEDETRSDEVRTMFGVGFGF